MTETILVTTTTSTTQTIITTATVEASTSAKFIKEIVRLDTSGMTALSSVNRNANLADGTYKISTTEELSILASMTNAGFISEGDTFVLANDIDMSSCTTWTPIGNTWETGNEFYGVFDGNGYVISSLYVTMSESFAGLFGTTNGSGSIKNLGIDNFKITNLDPKGGNDWGVRCGILIGVQGNINSKIENCFVTNSSAINQVNYNYSGECNNHCGGIVAQSYGSLDSCFVENVSLSAYKDGYYDSRGNFGGLIGCHNRPNQVILNCYVKEVLLDPQDNNSEVNAGVFIGFINDPRTYANCYAVNVSGANVFVGKNNDGTTQTFSNCYIMKNGSVTTSSSGYSGTYEHTTTKPLEVVVDVDEDISYTTTTTSTTNTEVVSVTTTSVSTQTSVISTTTTTTTTETQTLRVTTVEDATLVTRLQDLGLSYGINVDLILNGRSSRINLNKNMTIEEMLQELNSKGLHTTFDGGVLSIQGVGDSYLSSARLVDMFNLGALNKLREERTVNSNSLRQIYEKNLLDELGDVYAPGRLSLQVGLDASENSQLILQTAFSLSGYNEFRNIGLSTFDYLKQLDEMLEVLNTRQVEFGAMQNRLESVLDEITIRRENLLSSLSTIRDADIAEVSSTYIQQQILQQASATLLATANQSPALALQLL